MTLDLLARLALIATLYGGPGLVGLLILLIGASKAQRRSSVIAIASTAGVCVLLNATTLYFLADLAGAWSGGRNWTDTILLGSGGAIVLLGAAAVPIFLSRKLERPESAGPADTARGAAIAISVFLVVYLISALLRSDPVPGPSVFLRPHFWVVVVVSGMAAWGLWRHARWAWWLGVAGTAWELLRFLQHLAHNPSIAAFVMFSVSGLLSLILLIVLALLLWKNTRGTCLR